VVAAPAPKVQLNTGFACGQQIRQPVWPVFRTRLCDLPAVSLFGSGARKSLGDSSGWHANSSRAIFL